MIGLKVVADLFKLGASPIRLIFLCAPSNHFSEIQSLSDPKEDIPIQLSPFGLSSVLHIFTKTLNLVSGIPIKIGSLDNNSSR